MFFRPILAGAGWRDRSVASLGATVGIVATYLLAVVMMGSGLSLPLLVAPIGASAVLVFAVPASPLAQPWPVIGGNVVSVLVGVTVARLVPAAPVAAGLAVGGAIVAMSLLRCLHPPGGAAALIAVLGGPAVAAAGYGFAFQPVGINAVALTCAGLLFHRVSGHRYPHRSVSVPADAAQGLHRRDIDAALADLRETFDIDRDDLEALLRRAEHHAGQRRQSSQRR